MVLPLTYKFKGIGKPVKGFLKLYNPCWDKMVGVCQFKR